MKYNLHVRSGDTILSVHEDVPAETLEALRKLLNVETLPKYPSSLTVELICQ